MGLSRRITTLLATVAAACVAAGCGQRGPLTLPTPTAPPTATPSPGTTPAAPVPTPTASSPGGRALPVPR